jgi:acylphosphatase
VRQLPGIVGGYVKNLPDGTVEVEVESEGRGPLEALLIELHRGPAAAQVTLVEPTWQESAPARYISFRIG